MNISEKGIALIKRFEGFSATPYRCPAGKWTIGYGHVIVKNKQIQQLSEEEAHQLLLKDVQRAEDAIRRHVEVKITQKQFDALCSFIYNVGVGAFVRSTLLKKLNRREKAASEFDRWVYAGKEILPGLIARRQAERELFEIQ